LPRSSASASSTIAWSSTASPSTAADKRPAVRLNGRAALRIAGLVGLFAVLAPVHIITKAVFGRSKWPRRFLAAAGWIIGIRVTVEGRHFGQHALVLANHTSWLDILVLGGSTDCAFVSKDELGHPLIHWLADQNATVYVNRTDRKGARDQALALAGALERGKPMVVFPEGTTGPGTYLLPFRSTLLEAANFVSKAVQVRPVAIDYGDARSNVGWYHEPGRDNVFRLLGRRGSLPVTVKLLPAISHANGRKQLAQDARDAIAETLGLTSLPHSPIGGDR
jgi:1-acyl-sn-glycerol-3-phosphate acyltransferase